MNKSGAGCFESFNVEAGFLKCPARSAAASAVPAPYILVGANDAFDAVLWHQVEQRFEVGNVLLVDIRGTLVRKCLPGDGETNERVTPGAQPGEMKRRLASTDIEVSELSFTRGPHQRAHLRQGKRAADKRHIAVVEKAL